MSACSAIDDFFRTSIDQMIDLRDPLVVYRQVDWIGGQLGGYHAVRGAV